MNSNNNLFGATMRYGLVYGSLIIVLSLIKWPLQLSETSGFGMLAFIGITGFVFQVWLLVYFMKKFRDEVSNAITTFSQSYMVGILTVVFGSLIVAIYNFVFHSWIEPDFTSRASAIMLDKMINFYNTLGIPDEQIDQILDQVGELESSPTPVQVMIGGLKGSFIGGALLSIIGALIIKKNKPQNGFESAMTEIDDDKK